MARKKMNPFAKKGEPDADDMPMKGGRGGNPFAKKGKGKRKKK